MLRIAVPRIRFVQRTSCLMPKRYESEGAIRNDGKSSFSKKEKALEDQWTKMHDADKLKHLREEYLKQEKELNEMRKKIDEVSTKNTKS